MKGPDYPTVSVIMPVRNEADFIERSLRSVATSTYPKDRFEVLVVDGMSDDGTREVVTRLAREFPNVRLLDNPQRFVSQAMNAGIRAARGDIIVRVDGHALVVPSFLAESVRLLLAHPECWCAGGTIETVAHGLWGRVIAAALATPLGAGNAMFRRGGYEGYVDTLAFGAYWRWVFDRVGLFDEELVRNQDDELNARIIAAGGRIYMSSQIRTEYYARLSLGKLWRQYYQYGFWRIRTIQKLGRPAAVRQVVPLAFVGALALAVAAAFIGSTGRLLLAAFASAYGIALAVGTCMVVRRVGWRASGLAFVVFLVLHFAYGLGSWRGVLAFALLRHRAPRSMTLPSR